MQKKIKKWLTIALMLGGIILYPSSGLAADINFNINIMRQDGATCGEVWFNDRLVWRLALLSDGAKPVTGGFVGTNTTWVIPDILHGMFVVKVE